MADANVKHVSTLVSHVPESYPRLLGAPSYTGIRGREDYGELGDTTRLAVKWTNLSFPPPLLP